MNRVYHIRELLNSFQNGHTGVLSINLKGKTILHSITKTVQYEQKVLLNSFHLNGHTLEISSIDLKT